MLHAFGFGQNSYMRKNHHLDGDLTKLFLVVGGSCLCRCAGHESSPKPWAARPIILIHRMHLSKELKTISQTWFL